MQPPDRPPENVKLFEVPKINHSRLTKSPANPQKNRWKSRPAKKYVSRKGAAEIGV